MADLLSIGLSGLAANKTALTVTGHNVTNVNTPGYTRQDTVQATRVPQFSGAGYVGSGTQVTDIRRLASEFLTSQLRSSTSLNGDLSAYRAQIEQLDSLLAGSETGVTPGLQKFFAALQVAAEDPANIPARQLLLSEAEGLAKRFNTVYDQIAKQNESLNGQLATQVDQVNRLASSIARYNDAIATAKANGKDPNDLLDAREETVRQLSQLIGVQVIPQEDNLNIFVGSGQPLVVGNTTATLSTVPGVNDPSRFDILFTSGSSQQNVTTLLTGGEIGGVLKFRSEVLDNTFNSLGRLALAISDEVNDQLGQGLDLRGQAGVNLFRDINDPQLAALRVLVPPTNTGDIGGSITISDTTQLTTSDYELSIAGGNYQIRRLSDNQIVAGAAVGTLPGNVSFDGITVALTGTTFNNGDRLTLQPTRRGATDIAKVLDQPDQLALGGPAKAQATLNNRGTGKIGQPDLIAGPTPIDPAALSAQFGAGINLTYTPGAPPTLTGALPPGVTLSYVSPLATGLQPGQTNTLQLQMVNASGTYNFQFTLSGVPQSGDSFTLGFNANGVSNNSNGLKLVKLQSQATVGVTVPGTTGVSFNDAYGDLVERVGTLTSQVRIDNQASEIILKQAQDNRDSLSGVNLDEEAAKLIQFEQYYQASAQIIQVARSLFDTLINTFN
ncbi:flagellar hook-associated protein FlgK [Aquipseudomonas alcaligenes]|jgi:flagellar hook-associated protein 1 FlgK|uniref:flagellar hook-associated protein FlgK n=1 Tax=Aquipseudomonas alcaligenes TaxID=43263 RepID=UPI001EFF6773|nr:flagellar hook-associated protein FlgK [Pseudomonas alcaligenes]